MCAPLYQWYVCLCRLPQRYQGLYWAGQDDTDMAKSDSWGISNGTWPTASPRISQLGLFGRFWISHRVLSHHLTQQRWQAIQRSRLQGVWAEISYQNLTSRRPILELSSLPCKVNRLFGQFFHPFPGHCGYRHHILYGSGDAKMVIQHWMFENRTPFRNCQEYYEYYN